MNNPSYEIPEEPKNGEAPGFDLFAKPEVDNLKEELAKGSHQWTNKFTKVLLYALIAVSLFSAGAWYGHRSAIPVSAIGFSGASTAGGGFSGRQPQQIPTPETTATGKISGGKISKAKPGATTASNSPTSPTSKPTIAAGGRGQGQPGGGGGLFNNPELVACLAKEGVVIEAGSRPDRTDPKIAAAMQKCFTAAGVGGPGAPGGPGGPGSQSSAPK